MPTKRKPEEIEEQSFEHDPDAIVHDLADDMAPELPPHDNPPDISILMPVYNATKSVVKAIRSAREQQAGVTVEVLVANDASTDGSENKLGNASSILTMPQNSGPAACLNALIPSISGRFVMTLEADDWLEPDSLAALYTALDLSGKDFAYGWTQYHGIENNLFQPRAPHKDEYFYGRFESLYAVMFRRECLERCRWHTFAAGYGMHDYDFVLQLIEAGYQGVAVPQLVLHYDYQPTGLAHEMKPRLAEYRAELRERHPKLVLA